MATITIIEDDEHIAELLAFMIEREGHVAEVFGDGDSAQRHIASAPAPALVLLDAMLPYRDGLALLTEIRTSATWKATPVVMLTARSLESDIVRALDLGANDYVVKPFQPQELLARVRRFVRGSGA